MLIVLIITGCWNPFCVFSVRRLKRVDRLILPGVGSFDNAIERLNNSGLRDDIEDLVFKKFAYYRVCIGLQIMAKTSSEGLVVGLVGSMAKLKLLIKKKLILPHIGWNEIQL